MTRGRHMQRNDVPPEFEGYAAEMASQATNLMNSGKWKQAQEVWQSLASEQPASAYVWNKLGVCYAQQEEIQKAEEAFKEALNIEPKMAAALSNLGNVEMSRGNARAAADLYESAIRVSPDYAVAHHNLSAAYKKLGQIDKAVAQMKKARSLEGHSDQQRGYLAVDKSEPRKGFGGCFLWLLILGAMVFILVLLR